MALPRASSLLKNKTNIRSVGNRLNEATAEDFNEIGSLLDAYAEAIELLTGSENPNPSYGTFSSLLLLQASFPVGETGAYAVIDPGVGSPPQIALWDDTDGEWVLQVTKSTETVDVITQGDNVTNHIVSDINNVQYMMVSGTLLGTDPTRLEDYSPNSIYREL